MGLASLVPSLCATLRLRLPEATAVRVISLNLALGNVHWRPTAVGIGLHSLKPASVLLVEGWGIESQ